MCTTVLLRALSKALGDGNPKPHENGLFLNQLYTAGTQRFVRTTRTPRRACAGGGAWEYFIVRILPTARSGTLPLPPRWATTWVCGWERRESVETHAVKTFCRESFVHKTCRDCLKRKLCARTLWNGLRRLEMGGTTSSRLRSGTKTHPFTGNKPSRKRVIWLATNLVVTPLTGDHMRPKPYLRT